MAEALRHCYCKRGSPNLSLDDLMREFKKDPETIKRGDHPYIGYVERVGNRPKKPITDAWWM